MTYVDDAILMARDEALLQKVLDELKGHGYDFSHDGDFKSYLGVQLDTLEYGSLRLSQPHLICSFVDSIGLGDAASVYTPSVGPLFRYPDSQPHDKSFNYRSAIGMLQYLGQNTQPDCSYAITSCSRYCIDPKLPHTVAVKCIARYLKSSMTQGIIFKLDLDNLAIDCHCDADYAGNWNLADPENAEGIKLHTGFLPIFAGVPLLWKS